VIEFLAPNVYIEQLASAIRAVPPARTAVTGFVGAAAQGPVDQPVEVVSLGAFIAVFGSPDVAYPMSHAVAHFFENGGTRGEVVRVVSRGGAESDPITDDDLAGPALEPADQGIWALRDSGVDLVVVPPLGPGTDVSAATRRAVVALAVGERAFAVLDPPEGWATAGDVAVADLGLVDHHENAAVYWPWIEAADGAGGAAAFPPSGAVAGVYSRIDRSRGVWKAPAGTEAALAVTDLTASATDAEIEQLNSSGVNTLRTTAAGHVMWGARTLAASHGNEWRYVPVRRTALFLERSLYNGLDWVVFEPNDEPLWAQLRLTVDAFMADMWGDGAFRGDKAHEAYFVRCDRSTTTQADVDRHVVNIVVGFAPLKPAEFVVIEVALTTA
jgi:phage tail sheath protein FI